MNSLIIKICEKSHCAVEALDELIDSPECWDKIAAIDKTIEVVKEHMKPLNSDNSSLKLLELFPQVIDRLKEAKSALESEVTGDYKTKIWNAKELIDHIRISEYK